MADTPGTGRFGRPLARESLSRQAYAALRGALMTSALRPGQRLVARQVAEDLGVSITPAREALLRLVSEGVLAMDGRGGVMVPELSAAACREIRDMRMLIEGEGAALAAARRRPEDVEALARLHADHQAREAAGDHAGALEANQRFHFRLAGLGGSAVLTELAENLWLRFGPLLPRIYENGRRPFRDAPHAHEQVIAALRAGDAEGARAAIRRDIHSGGESVFAGFPDPDPAPAPEPTPEPAPKPAPERRDETGGDPR